MDNSIKIQYFGTLRLLFHTKEEILQINKPVTFAVIIDIIDKKYNNNFQNKANHLMFFHYPHDGEQSYQLRYPKDKEKVIKNNSIIKIFNAMTLG